MASVTRLPDGKKRVQFVSNQGSRKTIHLGDVDMKQAESVRTRVEALLAAELTGYPLDRETAAWLGAIDDRMHVKLANVGLVKPRIGRALGDWLAAFMESRASLKPESRRKLEQTRTKLEAFFGKGKAIHQITAEDASRWRDDLGKKGLGEAAVKTHIGNAKTMFREAVERELLTRSPFSHLKGGVTPTKNNRYVTPEEIERVLDAAPDPEWRLLIGLARLAGLRTPSETQLLTWDDVDWEGCMLRVRSPKTERHPGHEQRMVPIVPRLMDLLRERRVQCPGDEPRLVTIRSAGGRRRKIVKIIADAGVEPWADAWQALRRSREIEWMQEWPPYAVCRWMGHTISVSARHYTNAIPDDLLARVTGRSATQNTTLHASAPKRTAHRIA